METCIYLFFGMKLPSEIWLFPIFLQNSTKLLERNMLNHWKRSDITPFHIIFDAFYIKSVLYFNSYTIFNLYFYLFDTCS
jgi:hypothetical protein